MLAEYLTRGVTVGVVAGLVFGLFVAIVAAPTVAFADELGHSDAAIETAGAGSDGDHAHDHTGDSGHTHDEGAGTNGHAGDAGHAHADGVPGPVTTIVSIASSVLWGVLLGVVVFGAGFYLLEPLLPGAPGSGVQQAVLAGVGFIAVSGAPWLVLPPQPPGVESSLPVGTRLELYGGMMVLGTLCGLLALWAFDRLHPGTGDATDDDDQRSLAVTAVGVLAPFGLLVVAVVLAPTASAEGTLPATLSTGIVGMTVFGQLLLWATLAGAHAWLQRRDGQDEGDHPRDAADITTDLDAGSTRSRSAD